MNGISALMKGTTESSLALLRPCGARNEKTVVCTLEGDPHPTMLEL